MSDFLLEAALRGVLGGKKRKKSKKALRYLTGHHRGGSIFMNPNTIMTAAGLAWGIFETLQQPAPAAAGPAGAAAASTGGGLTAANLPPLPNVGGPAADAARLVQLAVSAANADGAMNDQERAAIVQHAGGDAAAVVARELEQRRPLAQIVGGVSDPVQRATLYVLAFTIVRADEQVSGAERIYLAQLANLLGLDPAAVQRLEADTTQRIDAANGES
jgi:uncharacterized membrane protein YebE (DUF533 family)